MGYYDRYKKMGQVAPPLTLEAIAAQVRCCPHARTDALFASACWNVESWRVEGVCGLQYDHHVASADTRTKILNLPKPPAFSRSILFPPHTAPLVCFFFTTQFVGDTFRPHAYGIDQFLYSTPAFWCQYLPRCPLGYVFLTCSCKVPSSFDPIPPT
jgi:hypothetical protein